MKEEELVRPICETQAKGGSSQIDISLIEHILKLSYEERIEGHESARQLVRDLQKAGQEYYARQSQSPT